MRRTLRACAALAVLCVGAAETAEAQGRTHAIIVVGLGGAAEYRDSFHAEASQIYTALIERHGLRAEDVTYLGEKVEVAPEMISLRSTRANVLQVLGEIALHAQPMDRVLVVLIGHGTAGGSEPQFNLPGPDLTPSDFQLGLMAFPTQSLALVHTGTASGGFVTPLSGPNRVLIAATRTERQLNATEFGQFFAKAIAGEGADLDHDDRISLLETFLYARQEVERYYQEQNELLTESAVLDDNGDGVTSHDAGITGPDGLLAATFHIGSYSGTAAQTPDDPVLARLYEERIEIQGRINVLRGVRDTMSDDRYLEEMEPLLVELALKTREIRAREGGTS
ncbi:MAG: hypothetical protein O2958_00065 [Gemmatimonadetes bacterium]|nr:hypothetical protein [Gemmatimonadota bacterium]MDA1104432.1 hypothetical protein [Gemmatimonadota bacterium]